ncbi:MAG: PilZ domain-containing protein [Terriglobales bacterium]
MARRQARLKGILPVRVAGVNAEGQDVSQLVHTLNISHTGVCLGGFRGQINVGDTVELQYKNQKAPFRVIWFRNTGSEGARVGLQCLEPVKKIWGLTFPLVDEYQESRGQESRGKQQGQRAHVRYAVQGGAEVRILNSEVGQWTQVTNVSLNGCFCETKTLLPVFTRVRVLMKIEGAEIDVYGVVRSHRPHKGMGIQFTEFVTSAEEKRLKAVIEKLQQQTKAQGA